MLVCGRPGDLGAAEAPPPPADEQAVLLSPFVVMTDKDNGYAATNTLAGSRLDTALRNTPAAISVFTKEFLQDIDALNTVDMLHYGLNANRDFTDMTGLGAMQQGDLRVTIRGFTGASLGRDYFTTIVSLDAFNTDRIEFSRGPNSILFGVGGPGGMVNTASKPARLNWTDTVVQARLGSWRDYRTTLDVTRPLGRNLALRLNGLWQERESWREFEYFNVRAGAAALTYRPFRHTQLRVNGEYADRDQNVAMPWPAADYIRSWLNAGKPVSPNNATLAGVATVSSSRALVYDAMSAQGPVPWFNTLLTARTAPSPSTAGNAVNLTDTSILPRSSNLSGPGATSDNWYGVYSVFLEQRLGGVACELAYNTQSTGRYIFYPVEWSNIGLYGDANGLLPNAALPNGQVPPQAGQANPNAGKFFVQSIPSTRHLTNRTENTRLTVAYEFDLTARSPWLGRHRLAALASRSMTEFVSYALNEVNLTPPGTALYPADITHGNNRIFRRTYLDFSQSDPRKRGQLDPWRYRLSNSNGVTSGFALYADTSSLGRTTTDSALAAVQSTWWKERVVVTLGARRDNQEIIGSNPATRNPATGEYNLRMLNASGTRYGGNTRTAGAVVHARQWLSLFYNNANTFVPQGEIDLAGAPLGPRQGRGEDFGVKLDLWSGRVNATISRYHTSDVNRPVADTRFNVMRVSLEDIAKVAGPAGFVPQAIARDSVDAENIGWEAEVTANPTKQWRLIATMSKGGVKQTNTFPRVGALIAANRAAWTQAGDRLLLSPPGNGLREGATVRDALAIVDANYAAIRQTEGQKPRQDREYSLNLFTTYTLTRGGQWLQGLTVGGGLNYRSPPVTGYDATRSLVPVYGGEYAILNAMLARTFRIAKQRTVRVQLNVDNVLGFDELIVTDKDNTGAYRYQYNQQVRKWSLSTTLKL